MSWLDDISRKRQDEAAASAGAEHALEIEVARQHPLIIKLLTEVGEAYWGPFNKPFSILNHLKGSWVLIHSSGLRNESWSVGLESSPEGRFIFQILGKSRLKRTINNSEEELRRVLYLAVQEGPRVWWSEQNK